MHNHIHLTEGLHVEEEAALKPEDARWLALLFGTEGAIGYMHTVRRRGLINEKYRYEIPYFIPYIEVEMDELQSAPTITEAAKLLRLPIERRERPPTPSMLRLFTVGGIALKHIEQMEPHLARFKRMAGLLQNIFKYRIYIRDKDFIALMTQTFGRYIPAKELNPTLLKMTPNQYETTLKKIQEYWRRKFL